MSEVQRIVCADWGKNERKRAVYEADLHTRVVRRVGPKSWDVRSLLAYAVQVPTLVSFDAPIGVPDTFLAALRASGSGAHANSFIEWLFAGSLEHSSSADEWSLRAPFFRVPAGTGALGKFEDAARSLGVDLRRKIEVLTGGKSVFVTSGVPGSVGSGALDVWRGLVAARAAGASFSVWPFEGASNVLDAQRDVVVAEIYPRAAYATALVDASPRARMSIGKTNAQLRNVAIDRLLETAWSKDGSARFEDLDAARGNEDDFDALMSAAALLRCSIEGLPMSSVPHAPMVEGAILGTGSVDLALPEVTLKL